MQIKKYLDKIIDNKITQNGTLNDEKTHNKLIQTDNLISFFQTIMFFVLIFCTLAPYSAYDRYLKNNITIHTHKVSQITYNNQYVTTTDNKMIKNPSKKVHIVKEPTNDPNKLGKSYYIIKTYTPEKITKLLSTNPNDYTKYQTRLEKHIYVKPYKNVNNNE